MTKLVFFMSVEIDAIAHPAYVSIRRYLESEVKEEFTIIQNDVDKENCAHERACVSIIPNIMYQGQGYKFRNRHISKTNTIDYRPVITVEDFMAGKDSNERLKMLVQTFDKLIPKIKQLGLSSEITRCVQQVFIDFMEDCECENIPEI